MAPEFLITEHEYGILNDTVRTMPDDVPVSVDRVTTPGGRRLGITWSTHLVTAADIGSQVAPTADPRDEHSRPLRLSYGFVCLDAWISHPADLDLHAARDAALGVYRQFLDGEDNFSVLATSAFPLRGTTTIPVTPAAGPQPLPTPRRSDADPRRPSPWLWGLALLVAVIAVVAVVKMLTSLDRTPDHERAPLCVGATQRSQEPTPTPSPTPTCIRDTPTGS
jgi:hypothetical protein